MNDILIISMDNIFATPYIESYIGNLKSSKIDVISWNRRGINETRGKYRELFVYNNKGNNFFINYYNFRKFVLKIIKKRKYEKLIILHGPLNILLFDALRKYRNKYILDIRDFTFENFLLYRILQKQNIKNSFATVISSEGFKEFLPKYNYIICHNNSEIVNKEYIRKNSKKNENKIVISQVGNIRFIKENNIFINNAKKYPELHLKFIGSGSDNLTPSKNITTEGFFESSETLDKYKDADFINNLYGNKSKNVKYALSNKLYIACYLKIPILVSPNTYMAFITEKYKIGIEIDYNNLESIASIKKYKNLSKSNVFNKGCEQFLKKVEEDNKKFEEKIREFEKNEKII